ncbi:hypothetical protein ATANTOWER_014292, partial [Ataeniobius toweri]|nr:hypothetical protein [Ataeniobius toweri]
SWTESHGSRCPHRTQLTLPKMLKVTECRMRTRQTGKKKKAALAVIPAAKAKPLKSLPTRLPPPSLVPQTPATPSGSSAERCWPVLCRPE